jgi:hypothetical protein
MAKIEQTPAAPDVLDQIAAEASVLEAQSAPVMPGAEVPAAPPVDPAQEWRDAVEQGSGLVLSVYPELQSEWTPTRLAALGNALAKCAEHYGWTVGGIFGHPLVGLGIAVFPLAVPLVKLGKAKAAEKQRNAAPTDAAPVGNGAPESVFSRAGNLDLSPQS